MKIIDIYEQWQDDFMFDAECEFCGHTMLNLTGKNTHKFYSTIPVMRCRVCGLTSKGTQSAI